MEFRHTPQSFLTGYRATPYNMKINKGDERYVD